MPGRPATVRRGWLGAAPKNHAEDPDAPARPGGRYAGEPGTRLDSSKGRVMGPWDKRDDMLVHEQSPYNAEPPPGALADRILTPLDTFYSRNHGPVPDIDPQAWRLSVGGLADTTWTCPWSSCAAFEPRTRHHPPVRR